MPSWRQPLPEWHFLCSEGHSDISSKAGLAPWGWHPGSFRKKLTAKAPACPEAQEGPVKFYQHPVYLVPWFHPKIQFATEMVDVYQSASKLLLDATPQRFLPPPCQKGRRASTMTEFGVKVHVSAHEIFGKCQQVKRCCNMLPPGRMTSEVSRGQRLNPNLFLCPVDRYAVANIFVAALYRHSSKQHLPVHRTG